VGHLFASAANSWLAQASLFSNRAIGLLGICLDGFGGPNGLSPLKLEDDLMRRKPGIRLR